MLKVAAAIIIKNNLILIAQRKTTDYLANKWEFPGGKIENSETSKECLKRELEEEFDIDIEVSDYYGKSIYRYPKFEICLSVYKAFWITGNIKLKDHKDYKWIKIEEVDNYDFDDADIYFVNKLKEEML